MSSRESDFRILVIISLSITPIPVPPFTMPPHQGCHDIPKSWYTHKPQGLRSAQQSPVHFRSLAIKLRPVEPGTGTKNLRGTDHVGENRLRALEIHDLGEIALPVLRTARPDLLGERTPAFGKGIVLLFRIAHEVQMRGQVIERITEHRQFPVDRPEPVLPVQDEILPVQIGMEQTKGAFGQVRNVLSELF